MHFINKELNRINDLLGNYDYQKENKLIKKDVYNSKKTFPRSGLSKSLIIADIMQL